MNILQNKRYLWSGILLCGCMAFQARATDVEFRMTYTQPTCGVSFDGGRREYPLGILATGFQKKHTPFSVYVNCQGNTAVKTAITAKVISGLNGLGSVVQPGNDSVRMQVVGTSGVDNNSPELWLLTDAGNRVKLTGLEGDAFCTKGDTSASTPNTCKLTPVTAVPAGSALGRFGVTMRFNVEYPQ